MKTLQEKFFELLKRRAGAANFEVVVSYDFANTGRLYLQRPGSFETALELTFEFHLGRASFASAERDETKRAEVFPGRPVPSRAGFKGPELDEAINAIVAYAKSAVREEVGTR